ncbi:hypothetical protein K1719_011203 [Acacia pycnantha]|nr:hypothetical protein K1719_011203 [Acacia pycnantha]
MIVSRGAHLLAYANSEKMYASYHNTYTRNQASHSTDWRKRAGIKKLRNSIKTKISDFLKSSLHGGTLQKESTITLLLERELFSQAASEEEYKNPETIMKVLQKNFRGIMFAASNINFTGYETETANHTNNYQFSNQRKSHVSVGNKRTFAPYSNFKASGRTSNLNSSSRPIFSHLQQQQHRDHVEMDWVGYNGNQSLDFLCKPSESPLSIHGAAYGLESANNTMDWVNYNRNQVSDFLSTPRESPRSIYGAASNLAERRDDHCYGLESANNTMDWVNYNGNQVSDFLSTPRESPLSIYGATLNLAEGTVVGQGYLEDIFSPPTKILKIEPTASVSNNDIYKIWDSHMVPTNSCERLPKLHQQEEPSFPTFPQVTKNHMESSANAMQESVSFSNANNAIGVEAILFGCRDKYKLRDSYPKSNDEEQDKNGIESTAKSITNKVIELEDDLDKGTMSSKTNPITTDASYDVLEQTNKGRTISEGIEAGNRLEDSYLNSGDVKLTDNNPQTDVDDSNSSDHTLQKDPIVDKDDVQRENELDQSIKNNEMEVIEPKSDLNNGEKSAVSTLRCVSLPENFTCDQIRNHIMSLKQDIGQSILEEEIITGDNSCSLCGIKNRVFQRQDICCLSCNKIIKRDTKYYGRKAEHSDEEQCFCMACFNNSKGDSIQFNGVSLQKELLDCKKNNHHDVEGWVQCDKCQRWQHQICALFDDKRNLEGNCQTKLSDHIEQRLLSRLEHEREQKAKAEGKNVDEISGAENLIVRVVLSIEKQLKVKKEFLDILSGANYPPEFPYTSKNIDGADVLIYVIFVQEFGSECSHPNHRSVHISYLDSVNHFTTQRETVTGEALRTFVYHEILIGYLGFCKKRGFEKCYIWACPPMKGENYVLYCHPKSQKTPLTRKLRHWYLSMIRKASEEDIVVNHTNMHDQFFVASKSCNSKVTAARLPYFDGDYGPVSAIDEMMRLQEKYEGDYDKMLEQPVTKRALKSMGHTKPSKDTIKDILVMHKLSKTMFTYKEDFIIAQLQYACTLCHEVILSGKRWFCIECKKYLQCERCHTSDTHTSTSGEKHTLPNHCLSENQGSDERKTLMKQQFLKILKHACHCSSTKSQPCSYPKCAKMKRWFAGEMKRLISHVRGCSIKEQRGCESCKKARFMLNLHLNSCKDSKCCICSRYGKDCESHRQNAISESVGE